jgi:hypothetical protein
MIPNPNLSLCPIETAPVVLDLAQLQARRHLEYLSREPWKH